MDLNTSRSIIWEMYVCASLYFELLYISNNSAHGFTWRLV